VPASDQIEQPPLAAPEAAPVHKTVFGSVDIFKIVEAFSGFPSTYNGRSQPAVNNAPVVAPGLPPNPPVTAPGAAPVHKLVFGECNLFELMEKLTGLPAQTIIEGEKKLVKPDSSAKTPPERGPIGQVSSAAVISSFLRLNPVLSKPTPSA
jgi:hypothetical protein